MLLTLKSRRVVVALSTLVVGLLVLAVPELQAVRGELLTLVITLSLALIGGYTVEDAAKAGRDRAATPPDDLRELIKDLLNGVVDELASKITPPNP